MPVVEADETGDLHVTINAELPDLTPEQRALESQRLEREQDTLRCERRTKHSAA